MFTNAPCVNILDASNPFHRTNHNLLFTKLIRLITQPISAEFCTNCPNEFCQDSRQYIGDLLMWKERLTKKTRNCKAKTSVLHCSGRCESTLPQLVQRHCDKSSWMCIVNHCVTNEDDFGFATKDFVKPTAEGRQFITGNSHHPQTTFKSILFGEAIRLRRLNQRKDDYLSSLNRLKAKAICSKFPLNMTNDMIALASNWEDRLRPQNATRKNTHRFGLHLFPICLL